MIHFFSIDSRCEFSVRLKDIKMLTKSSNLAKELDFTVSVMGIGYDIVIDENTYKKLTNYINIDEIEKAKKK